MTDNYYGADSYENQAQHFSHACHFGFLWFFGSVETHMNGRSHPDNENR